MFSDIQEVEDFYKIDIDEKHKIIYDNFKDQAFSINYLNEQFNKCSGFGELSFWYSWYLIFKTLPKKCKVLEIGVFRGRTLALMAMLLEKFNLDGTAYGVTPLTNVSDKFSKYKPLDYLQEIKNSFIKSGVDVSKLNIIKGLSQNDNVLKECNEIAPFDVIYIDGSHDYENVIQDIDNFIPMLNSGGYLVMDDASKFLKGAYGQFLGHPDVGKAIIDKIDNNDSLTHLYAVGHNRVWRKK